MHDKKVRSVQNQSFIKLLIDAVVNAHSAPSFGKNMRSIDVVYFIIALKLE